MLYILVPTYNRVDVCKSFIRQVYEQTDTHFKLIIVDHGQEKVKIDDENIVFIESDVNGWARAVNVGLRYILRNADDIDSSYVLVINDDVELPVDYIERIKRSINENPSSVIGSYCIDINDNKILRGSIKLNKLKAKFMYADKNKTLDQIENKIKDSHVLTGKGVVFPCSLLSKYGIYAEEKLPHYKADHELVWRMHKKGVNVIVSKEMYLYTVSDQMSVDIKMSLLKNYRKLFFKMTSIYNLKDLFKYSILSFGYFYGIYFFVRNFFRYVLFILLKYVRTNSISE